MATQQTVSVSPNAAPAPFDRPRTVVLLSGALLVGVIAIGALLSSGQATVSTHTDASGQVDGLREFRRQEIGADAAGAAAPDALREQRRGEIGADAP